MGAGHTHSLHVEADTPVHRLPAHVKLVALVAFVLLVVATPREAIWAFGIYLGLLMVVRALARIPLRTVLPRMVVELPFVLFAVLLPFIALGEQTTVLGVEVSIDGLWAAWNLLVKGTLGVIASILLGATTQPRDLILGLQRLRVPNTLVQILTFMLRYVDVVLGEMRRMKVARESRAFEGRSIRQLPVVAHSAGALFIRTYERGERVHLAMLSRGYNGAMPVLEVQPGGPAAWAAGAVLPLAALFVCTAAWILT